MGHLFALVQTILERRFKIQDRQERKATDDRTHGTSCHSLVSRLREELSFVESLVENTMTKAVNAQTQKHTGEGRECREDSRLSIEPAGDSDDCGNRVYITFTFKEGMGCFSNY